MLLIIYSRISKHNVQSRAPGVRQSDSDGVGWGRGGGWGWSRGGWLDLRGVFKGCECYGNHFLTLNTSMFILTMGHNIVLIPYDALVFFPISWLKCLLWYLRYQSKIVSVVSGKIVEASKIHVPSVTWTIWWRRITREYVHYNLVFFRSSERNGVGKQHRWDCGRFKAIFAEAHTSHLAGKSLQQLD